MQLLQSDCLDALKEIQSKSINFTYLDPPFNTGKKRSYKDKWESPEAYSSYMRDRLLEIKRVTSGSVMVHCDHNMSHHIRLLMDEIFLSDGKFINEIVWRYGLGGFRTKDHLPRKHDNLLWYSVSKTHTFNSIRLEPTKAMLAKYCHTDEGGRYMTSYGRKYYMKGGKPIDDVWVDIPNMSPTSGERVGYDTQKPLALMKRIIGMATNVGDVVLDPFCGSGTTVVAALMMGRSAIGVDMSSNAISIVKRRIESEVNNTN